MLKWMKELNIKDSWQNVQEDEMSVIDLTKEIVDKLKKIKYEDDDLNLELTDIVEWFQDFIDNGSEDKDEFDSILTELYDFGDQSVGFSTSFYNQKKALWIRT